MGWTGYANRRAHVLAVPDTLHTLLAWAIRATSERGGIQRDRRDGAAARVHDAGHSWDALSRAGQGPADRVSDLPDGELPLRERRGAGGGFVRGGAGLLVQPREQPYDRRAAPHDRGPRRRGGRL